MIRELVQASLRALVRGEDLGAERTATIFRAIMAGELEAAQVAAILVGLACKRETADEIRGAALAMREASVVVPTTRTPVIDVCGTGGSGVARRNVSTAVAFAVAACGVGVAKHGNRAASSRSGSADVLEALGVALDPGAERVGRDVDELGVGFLFARALHPAMRFAGPVRAALGVPTVFNLLGPMTNPALVRRQVVGVFDPSRLHDVAQALLDLGSERVFVVHGFAPGISPGRSAPRGLDDLSTDGPSLVVEGVRRAGVTHLVEHVLSPEDAGLQPHPAVTVAGEGPAENAAALRALLAGGRDSGLSGYRMAVQYAGGLSLLVAGDDGLDQLPQLAARIGDVLDDGAALARLDALVARAAQAPTPLPTAPS